MPNKVEVTMKQDQQQNEIASLQKLQYSKQLMPTNMILDTIIKKKSLEFADLTSTEIAEVLKSDQDQMKQAALAQQNMAQTANLNPGNAPGGQLPAGAPGQPQPQGQPGPQQMPLPMPQGRGGMPQPQPMMAQP